MAFFGGTLEGEGMLRSPMTGRLSSKHQTLQPQRKENGRETQQKWLLSNHGKKKNISKFHI